MAIRKHTNNYSSTLNGAINDSVTTIVVTSATGLPSIGAGEEYNLTLDDGAGVIEIVTVTDDVSSPSLTVTRGAEGTTPVSWADLATIELRPTANSIDRKADLDSPALITPALGTPASGILTNCTGLPGLLYNSVVTSAVTSLTINGLDISSDKYYILEIEKDNAVACTWYLHVNGDTTVSNYYTQSLLADNTTFTATRLNSSDIIFSGTTSGSYATVHITKSESDYLMYTSYHGRNLGGTAPQQQHFVGCSSGTIANITSITITASASNGIGVGSTIRLYKGVV